MKAIRFERTGGPEVLQLQDVNLEEPGTGEVQLRHTAIGLNFVDTYYRSGLYPSPLPSGLGNEAAGVVTKLGKGVKALKVGDRVAYGTGALGAYQEARNFPANRLVKLPKAISDEVAAGMMLKGMTTRYLLRATYKVKKGQTVLFHAAAGGVGLIFGQWAKALGVKAIGTVGSDEKVAIARKHGYAHVINSSTEDVVARVKEITKGKGVPVVYDGVGQATFNVSLDCLSPLGLLVSFGNASGAVSAFNLGILAGKGSLYVTRPTLGTYVASDADFQATARDLVNVVKSGKVKIQINQRYKLADAAKAHEDLAARRTTGATVLIP
ncbi:quinone oxidoreductase family protein [Aestuariivirga litoralis]|uniref:quinone oxidoreductase family protein n=1 Tax=Aestuariivirga litoralis TaxID=2650924 RepID=UPI0018C6E366|nr:quinone oxidoreductase [Aestuariivirga litoralis]MBG1231679.1 quinone oxidoreductase [Aestuariivirga litoralis]